MIKQCSRCHREDYCPSDVCLLCALKIKNEQKETILKSPKTTKELEMNHYFETELHEGYLELKIFFTRPNDEHVMTSVMCDSVDDLESVKATFIETNAYKSGGAWRLIEDAKWVWTGEKFFIPNSEMEFLGREE